MDRILAIVCNLKKFLIFVFEDNTDRISIESVCVVHSSDLQKPYSD